MRYTLGHVTGLFYARSSNLASPGTLQLFHPIQAVEEGGTCRVGLYCVSSTSRLMKNTFAMTSGQHPLEKGGKIVSGGHPHPSLRGRQRGFAPLDSPFSSKLLAEAPYCDRIADVGSQGGGRIAVASCDLQGLEAANNGQ